MIGGPPTIDEVRPLIPPGFFWQRRPALKRWICRETAAVSVEELIGPYLAVPFIFIFLPITEHYLCSRLDMGVNPFWLSCWCSLQISTGGAGERVRAKNKLGKLLIIVHRKESIGNDITGGKEKNSGEVGNQLLVLYSSCLQRCSTIDLVVFIALAIIDLLKPYFFSSVDSNVQPINRWCFKSCNNYSNVLNCGRISLFFDASKGNEPSLKQSESLYYSLELANTLITVRLMPLIVLVTLSRAISSQIQCITASRARRRF